MGSGVPSGGCTIYRGSKTAHLGDIQESVFDTGSRMARGDRGRWHGWYIGTDIHVGYAVYRFEGILDP